MKRVLFSLVVLTSMVTYAQTIVFEDDFESYDDFIIDNVGDWTMFDIDELEPYFIDDVTYPNAELPRSFQVFNHTQTVPNPVVNTPENDFSGHNSDKAMMCIAGQPTADVVGNNDWLISPEIELGEGNTISFWYKAASQEWAQEKFTVGITTGDPAIDNFTLISNGVIMIAEGDNAWHQFTYEIPASYNGQSVHFSINCLSEDQYAFFVDDFKVESETLSVGDVSGSTAVSSIYPNPASDVVSVQLSSKFTASKTSATLYDLSGKKVKHFSKFNEINVSNLGKGIYILELTDGINIESKKLIVK